jgi:Fe-S cluster assembly iron-binding protein IscA
MLMVTRKAAAVLKAARSEAGAAGDSGIRIRRGTMPEQPGAVAIGFSIAEAPNPEDEQFEQQGLRFFVEDTLIEPLEGRTLDVREASEGPELIFR